MKILVHDYSGHPFQVQLSRELSRRGHEVMHLYAGYNQTPRGALAPEPDDPESFIVRGVYIRRPLDKDALVRRWLQESEYGMVLSQEIRSYRPQVVICANAPLDSLRRIVPTTHEVGGAFLFWLQDIYGIAAQRILGSRIPILGRLIGHYHTWLEKRLLKESDAIISISADFTDRLKSWSIQPGKIATIPNWAPIERMPVHGKRNRWSEAHEISDGFNYIYTGTLRLKHNPSLLLELARSVGQRYPEARMVVVSEGKAADWLSERAERERVSNLLIMRFQPMERYSEVLASADVLVAILEQDAGAFSVPSKVLSYLCAQRPLLLALPKENLAAKIVMQNDAGLVVAPDDFDGFIQAGEELYKSDSLRRQMGINARGYAEREFDIGNIGDKFEALIRSI